ncbi:MAG: alpha/beta fold hydrolase [Gemmatimonadetes bacterium]|nr:alpha/beta fold hydrolase [Gemmatimonadota bacterium]NNM03530.1 alpha/beta fold hydrolase [Gemmatimonadota bacterium]
MIVSLIGTLGAGLVVGGVGYLLDRFALGMIRPPYKPIRYRVSALPYLSESVSIKSGDQDLAGWIIRPEEDRKGPVLVFVHGWGSNHGTMTRLAGPLLGMGFPALVFDVRHHGKSRGAPFVTARHFRDDIVAAVGLAGQRFPGRPLVLVGHSMGGSTGVLAVAHGAPVQALISIGAPADMWEVWAHHLNQQGLPGTWVIKGLNPFWRFRAGVPWRSLDPRRKAGEIHGPFLVLHGAEDESVPVHHAFSLAEAGGVVPQVLPGEGHTDLLESPELHRIVVGFLAGLPQPSAPEARDEAHSGSTDGSMSNTDAPSV